MMVSYKAVKSSGDQPLEHSQSAEQWLALTPSSHQPVPSPTLSTEALPVPVAVQVIKLSKCADLIRIRPPVLLTAPKKLSTIDSKYWSSTF